jgi:hypothetical protein
MTGTAPGDASLLRADAKQSLLPMNLEITGQVSRAGRDKSTGAFRYALYERHAAEEIGLTPEEGRRNGRFRHLDIRSRPTESRVSR